MLKEYDYNHDDMSENVCVIGLPMTNPHSLHSSRKMPNNYGDDTHRKVLDDLQKFIEESKERESERIHEMKNRQKNIGDEINKRLAMKQSKRKQLELQNKDRLLRECTFQPKLHRNFGKKRNLNEFLQNQQAYTQKVKQKREMIKKQVEQKKEKATYKPKINNKSKQSSKNMPVYERLYALRDKQNLSDQENKEQGKQFHPSINPRSKNMVRSGPVQEMLYSDALRRQDKSSEVQMTSSSVASKMEKASNYNNQKYAAQKFIRQFFYSLEDLSIDSSLHTTVEYVTFNELLKHMGFMSNQQEYETKSSATERALLHDAFQILSKYQVNARNICVFLLALLGIYHINPVNFEEGEQTDETKQLNFDEIEGRKIQRHFDLFYRNRLSSEVGRRSQEKVQEYSFQPKINKQSVEMAEKHRNLMLEEANQLIQQYPEIDFSIPEDGVISHTDLLVLHKMAKDIQKQRIKYDRDHEQLKQCTFKPNTYASSLSNSKISQSMNGLAGYKKSHELYEYHKNLQNKKDSMKASRSQIDPECTFKPDINKAKIPPRALPVSKQTDETLYRMFKGRQQHEEKKKFLERGQLIAKQRQSSIASIDQRVPSLILDVNLGQKVDRIVLFKGDEDRLSEVAQQFAEKHDLDKDSEEKLLEMLQIQMENILSKIQEDEESEEADNI